jgi:hypothetical protein
MSTSSPLPPAYYYNNPLLLSMFKTTHTPTITTMQSERLVSFQLCILGTMSTGVTILPSTRSSQHAKAQLAHDPARLFCFFSAFPYSTMTRHLNRRCKIPGPSITNIYSPTPTSVHHLGGREYQRRFLLTSSRAYHERTQSGMILIVFLFLLIDMYHYGSSFLSPTHICGEPFRFGKGTAFYYFFLLC